MENKNKTQRKEKRNRNMQQTEKSSWKLQILKKSQKIKLKRCPRKQLKDKRYKMQEEKENRVKENWRSNLRIPVSKYRWFPTQDDLAYDFFFLTL